MSNSLRLGIAGLGTVGTGVLDILRTHGPLVDMRSGRGVVVTGVSARSKGQGTVAMTSQSWNGRMIRWHWPSRRASMSSSN